MGNCQCSVECNETPWFLKSLLEKARRKDIMMDTSSTTSSTNASQDDDAIDCTIHETPIHERPNMRYVFSYHFTTGEPIIVNDGPKGHRYIFPDLQGTFKGGPDYEDFHGTIYGPSSDFASVHSDKSGVTLDINMVLRTHDGIVFVGKALGRSARDKKDPMTANFTSAFTFEAGHKKLKHLNNMVAIGHGKKVGNRIQIDYYVLKD